MSISLSAETQTTFGLFMGFDDFEDLTLDCAL